MLATGLLGTEVTWARPDQVADVVRPDTALVVVETPANPTLDLVDIAALAAAAGEVPLLVDNTAPRLDVVADGSVLAGAVYRVGVRAVDDLAGLSAPARVWFGDGAASVAPATHRYRRSGPHQLRVTVADRAGNESGVSRRLRVVELRLAAPRQGAVVIVTLGRPTVVRIAAARVRLRRVLSAGRHRLSLGRLGRGRYVVTAEARGFRARTIVRVV